MGFLEGKSIIVTGGTRGIGRSVAEAVARDGAGVTICGREDASSAAAAAELRSGSGGTVVGRGCDVRERASVRALFDLAEQTFGGVDVVINNAGIGVFAPVATLSEEDWHRVLETNVTGVFHCCQEAIGRFRKRGGGYLIQVSSLAAKNPFPGGGVYNASKFALTGFAEAMMLDHRHDGVRVTNILPGSVDTDFTPRSAPSPWKIAPEDIAEIVLMLLRMPERTLVSAVEVRPSRPPKR